jgi:hypothetical protein
MLLGIAPKCGSDKETVSSMTAKNLRAEYLPTALYLEDADSVEYVRRDVACV